MCAIDASRLRTPAAILEAAARVFAERGAAASMADVAAAAGVGRATLYRHYPNRESLLQALAGEAVADAAARIAGAGLDGVPPEEAIRRVARALVATGSRYAILFRERVHPDDAEVEALIATPVRRVLARAAEEGLLRTDVPVDLLGELFGGLLEVGVRLAGDRRLPDEDVVALITDTFLAGAGSR